MRAAEETLHEARVLLNAGLLHGAINRAYYVMFYTASGLVISRNVKLPRTHKGVLQLFSRHITGPGILPREYHTELARLLRTRIDSDYELQTLVQRAEVERTVDRAGAFLEVARVILDNQADSAKD